MKNIVLLNVMNDDLQTCRMTRSMNLQKCNSSNTTLFRQLSKLEQLPATMRVKYEGGKMILTLLEDEVDKILLIQPRL